MAHIRPSGSAVAFRPVHLDVARADICMLHSAVHAADTVVHHDGFPFVQGECLRVFLMNQHVVAIRRIERIDVAVDHRIELLAAARRRRRNAPSGLRSSGSSIGSSRPRPSGVGQTPSSHSHAPPHWNTSPALPQMLDAVIVRRGQRDLLADRFRAARSRSAAAAPASPGAPDRRRCRHSARASPMRGPRSPARNTPSAPSRSTCRRPAARSASSPAARSPPPARPASVDVLRMMSWWTRTSTFSRASPDEIRVRHRLQEVAAGCVKQPQLALMIVRQQRVLQRDADDVPLPARQLEAPELLDPLRSSSGSKSPPGRLNGSAPISPEPCTPLWPRIGMTPQCSRPRKPRSIARLATCEMLSVPNRCCVSPMLQTNTPRLARGPAARRTRDPLAGQAGRLLERRPNPAAATCARSSSKPFVCAADERMVDRRARLARLHLKPCLHDAVHEGDVAADVHLVHSRRPASCRTAPIPESTESSICSIAGSRYGLMTMIFVPLPLGRVHVFRRDGLVVRGDAAPEDEHVRADPVLVAAARRADAERALQRGLGRRMADARSVVDIVRAEEARHLRRHIIRLVRNAARRQIERQSASDRSRGFSPRSGPSPRPT